VPQLSQERAMIMGARETAIFAVMVGFAAIFVDAAIAHGLFWDNDPYWTYWITKTFLITTVFLLGTSWIGIGIWQGAVLTVVHTAILEIYYQWFAPVGLPQEPEWLDFNHLWTTGVPAHYLAIFGGYLIALWAWRRSFAVEPVGDANARTLSLYSLVAAVIILVLDGIITQAVLLRDFPGITFFVQHLLIAFVFIYLWTAFVGVDRSGWIIGSLFLALVWITYSMYLGPRGLPLRPPTYSGYDDLWWKSFPGAFVSALIGWWLMGRLPRNWKLVPATVVPALFLLLLLPQDSSAQQLGVEKGTNALRATARASGDGMRVVGADPVNMKSTQPMNGSITIETWEMGNRWSHVQNTDAMKVVANFSSGGARYEVTIDKPMARHPLGRYTTWSGVVYEHEMHGDTGIGTAKLPKMKPEIALWGWAEIKKNGQVISRMTPGHVMVSSSGPLPGIMLELDTEDKALVPEPDGYLHVMWHKIDALEMPTAHNRTRMIIGWAALIGIVVLFGALTWNQPDRRRRAA
jgi:hypothetical protein